MTTRTTETIKKELLIKRLILCGALGVAIGLAVGFIWANRENAKLLSSGPNRCRSSLAKQPIRPNEILKLGVSLIKITRQITDLINKA